MRVEQNMPRTTTLECPGCPPLRALTFDELGLIKGISVLSYTVHFSAKQESTANSFDKSLKFGYTVGCLQLLKLGVNKEGQNQSWLRGGAT